MLQTCANYSARRRTVAMCTQGFALLAANPALRSQGCNFPRPAHWPFASSAADLSKKFVEPSELSRMPTTEDAAHSKPVQAPGS